MNTNKKQDYNYNIKRAVKIKEKQLLKVFPEFKFSIKFYKEKDELRVVILSGPIAFKDIKKVDLYNIGLLYLNDKIYNYMSKESYFFLYHVKMLIVNNYDRYARKSYKTGNIGLKKNIPYFILSIGTKGKKYKLTKNKKAVKIPTSRFSKKLITIPAFNKKSSVRKVAKKSKLDKIDKKIKREYLRREKILKEYKGLCMSKEVLSYIILGIEYKFTRSQLNSLLVLQKNIKALKIRYRNLKARKILLNNMKLSKEQVEKSQLKLF